MREGRRSPFVLSPPQGSNEIREQAKFFGNSDLSRGFYRTQGLPNTVMKELLSLQLTLIQSIDSELGKTQLWDAATSPDDLILATGNEDWSMLLEKGMRDTLEAMQSNISGG